MPVNNRATLLANLNTYITSQVNPDTITPVILGGMLADIIDSMVDQLDQNVNGLTISQIIQNAIDLNNSNGGIVNPYLFSATKNVAQPIDAASANTLLLFEDDSTAPNFDNSNLFHVDRFVANAPMTKSFHIEQLVVKHSGSGTVTFRVRFLKNGAEIATTLAANHTTADVYGKTFDDASGYTYNSVSAIGVVLAQGDVITAELVTAVSSGSGAGTVASGKFSNS